MNKLRAIKRIWQSLPFSDHWRWRITACLLEPALPFIRGSVVHNAYLKEKEWHSKRIRPFYGDTFPELPPQKNADVILFSVIDWRYRVQRPQHLAQGLAALGHRVFYISTAFVNDSKAGFELEQMDRNGRLFNVRLHLKGRPPIHAAPPSQNDLNRLKSSIGTLVNWTSSKERVYIVQHPYWTTLVESLPDNLLIYDCIDHHSGFDNTGASIGALEDQLLSRADAITVTSQWLHDFAARYNQNVFTIRNAVEFDRFSTRPEKVFADPQGRMIIGYFGAIAGWMDIDLLRSIAEAFPDALLLLVGADEAGAKQKLKDLPNVMLTGEVAYADLPSYLHGMNVCILPFKIMPLTLATNPVKVYEYLSAGKSVVAVDLPEMAQFGNLVSTAQCHVDFIRQIGEAFAPPEKHQELARRNFASQNTWRHRTKVLESLISPRGQ